MRNLQKGEQCLNCGHALQDENFCPDCGQLNNITKPTFKDLVLDALANLFAFDSKFYLSIWPLITKPGKLSLYYIQGKKSTYLPPIRLFVLVTIIMLATNSLLNRCEPNENTERGDNEQPALTTQLNDSSIQQTTSESEQSFSNKDLDFSFTFGDSDAGSKLEKMFAFAKQNPNKTTNQALDSLALPRTF